MTDRLPEDITGILEGIAPGDLSAWERLLPLVYRRLREIAGQHFRHEHRELTLQPTALVHEAYLKLSDLEEMAWADRTHFLAVASSLMRRILVDHARARNAAKRGGDWHRTTLSGAEGLGSDVELLDLDDALTELARINERQARIVTLRFFGGLTAPETAAALSVSLTTVEADWRVARAWLRRQITS